MTKTEAVKEARIAALYQGGTWYVTRRGNKYNYMHSDNYGGSQKDGHIAEMFDAQKVRTTVPA